MRRARIKGLISHGCHLPRKGLNSRNGRHLRGLGQPVFDFLFHHNLWPCLTASLAFLLLVGYSSIPRSNTRGSLFQNHCIPKCPHASPFISILYGFSCLLSHSFQHSTNPLHPLTLSFALFHPSSLFCHQPPIYMSFMTPPLNNTYPLHAN